MVCLRKGKMNQILTKLEHLGTDVVENQAVLVVIPGQLSIPVTVFGVFDGMVYVEKANGDLSWVNAEFIYNNPKVAS